jgi:diketogulonate reductase-like aldo/keto reductase
VIAIPGANSIAQLEANVAAANIELSSDELLAIRRAADLVQYSKARATGQLVRQFVGRGGTAVQPPA